MPINSTPVGGAVHQPPAPAWGPDRLADEASDDAVAVARLAERLTAICRQPWTLMEVCGGQTHAIVRWGLDQLLPPGLRLIHGPGCPVCVTPAETVEQALALARRPEVILCSYGDMLRVPGLGRDDLLAVRAEGGDVRLLTTPLQALRIAADHPDRQVVFLAVGFETTAPATALLARQALAYGVGNLSLLNAHVRVAPAMEAILAEPGNRVQGFLAAGHVCAVVGTAELQALVARWRVPVVVSGFTARELMAGLHACVTQLEAGAARLENAYGAVVRAGGNGAARQLLAEVFQPCDRPWRGLGVMAGGGAGPAWCLSIPGCPPALCPAGGARRPGVSRRFRQRAGSGRGPLRRRELPVLAAAGVCGCSWRRRSRQLEQPGCRIPAPGGGVRSGRSAAAVHRRGHLARPGAAVRLPGFRRRLHTGASARGADGLQ